MEIEVRKTWETIIFNAKCGKRFIVVDLELNHQAKTFKLSTDNYEQVSFNSDDNNIEEAMVKLKLV